MARLVIFLCLTSIFAFSNPKNIYERNCVTCHNRIPVTIEPLADYKKQPVI